MKVSWDDYSQYEPQRDPTPFTRTCASRMAHHLRQTSIIFRQVEILLAHRRSKWTNSEAGNSNISIYYAFNVRLSDQKLTTICLLEQSQLSSSAWHTKFHGISNVQTWMWSTLHSHGFYDKFYFMPINPFIHFPMAHRWSDRLSFFRSSSYAFGFFRTASSPFTNLLVLCPKTAFCPEAAAQATTAAAADHCKAFPKPLRAGFWLAAILTRSERDENEVQNQILGDWPLSLLTNSLVATRFRILVRTVKLKSFQRWSRRANQAKHTSPPKLRDCNDSLKFVCQPKSRKNKQLPQLSSLKV